MAGMKEKITELCCEQEIHSHQNRRSIIFVSKSSANFRYNRQITFATVSSVALKDPNLKTTELS